MKISSSERFKSHKYSMAQLKNHNYLVRFFQFTATERKVVHSSTLNKVRYTRNMQKLKQQRTQSEFYQSIKRHMKTLRLSTACPFTSNVSLFRSISCLTVKHIIRIVVITVFCCNMENVFPFPRRKRGRSASSRNQPRWWQLTN